VHRIWTSVALTMVSKPLSFTTSQPRCPRPTTNVHSPHSAPIMPCGLHRKGHLTTCHLRSVTRGLRYVMDALELPPWLHFDDEQEQLACEVEVDSGHCLARISGGHLGSEIAIQSRCYHYPRLCASIRNESDRRVESLEARLSTVVRQTTCFQGNDWYGQRHVLAEIPRRPRHRKRCMTVQNLGSPAARGSLQINHTRRLVAFAHPSSQLLLPAPEDYGLRHRSTNVAPVVCDVDERTSNEKRVVRA
jgi:hypothetical protein